MVIGNGLPLRCEKTPVPSIMKLSRHPNYALRGSSFLLVSEVNTSGSPTTIG